MQDTIDRLIEEFIKEVDRLRSENEELKNKAIKQKETIEDSLIWISVLNKWCSEYLEQDIDIGERRISDLYHHVNNSKLFIDLSGGLPRDFSK